MSTQKFKLALISCAVIAAFPITTLAATTLDNGYNKEMPADGFIVQGGNTASITGTDIVLDELDGIGGEILDSSKVTIGTDQTNSISLSTTNSALYIESSDTKLEAKTIALSSSGSDTLSIREASNVFIGNENTETITITSDATGGSGFAGIFMRNDGKDAGPTVKLKAQTINITTEDSGVWLQNGTEYTETPDNRTHLTISAENITINTPNGSGLRVFSNSKLDVEGNLVINAKDAIDTRGNSIINVNTSGKYSTVLNGDIVFETPNVKNGDSHLSGSIINSKVTVGLTGENSSWTGRAYQSFPGNEDGVNLDGNDDFYGNVKDFTVSISDGARWEMTGNSLANTVNVKNGGAVTVHENVAVANLQKVDLDNGILNLEGSSNQTVTVSTLSGSGDINVKATTEDGKTLVTPKLAVNGVDPDEAPNLKVTATGITADQIVDADSAMKSLSDGLDLNGVNTVQTITEGDVNGAISQVIDAKGKA